MITFLTLDEIESIVGLPVPTSRYDRALYIKIVERLVTERYGAEVWLATVSFGPEAIGTILDEVQADWNQPELCDEA